ncbi:protein of unknown function [Paraburkholderia kururiensis]
MLGTFGQTRYPGGMTERKPYPTDVSDEEWGFAALYLALISEDAPQRRYELREMFNALRWMAHAGASWRMLPTNFLPWELVYQQTQRWLNAGCFEAMVNDLRSVLRVAQERQGQPSAVIHPPESLYYYKAPMYSPPPLTPSHTPHTPTPGKNSRAASPLSSRWQWPATTAPK